MLTYVVVAGPSIPPRVERVMRDPRPSGLHFTPRHHHLWSNSDGTVLCAGWDDGVDLGVGPRWDETTDGLCALTGEVVPRPGSWGPAPPTGAHLGRDLRTRLLPAVLDDLLGVFTIAALDPAGEGVVVSDPLGTCPLYRSEVPGAGIVSPSIEMAARLSQAPRDLRGVGWLVFSGQPAGARTGYQGVELLPMSAHARVSSTGIAIDQLPPPWRAPATEDPMAQLDALYADVVTSIRAALARSAERRVVELTGGRDSRLILAILLAEGLADQFEYRTFGGPELADVSMARDLAERFGLRHERGLEPEARRRAAARDERLQAEHPGRPLRELRLRATVGSWSGARNAWDVQLAAPPAADTVVLSGLYGETLSTNYPASTGMRTHADLRRTLLTHMRFGSARILQADALQQYQQELLEIVYQGFSVEDPPQDVLDAHYVRDRIRRWLGTTQEADERARIFPLRSAGGVRLAFSLGVGDRHWCWIYRELYRRSAPELALQPFATVPWPTRRAPRRGPEPTKPVRDDLGRDTRSTLRTFVARKRQRFRPAVATAAKAAARRDAEATDLHTMRRYLLDDPSNPIFELLDRVAVERAIADFPRLGELSKRQVYGALSGAIWMGGHEIFPAEH